MSKHLPSWFLDVKKENEVASLPSWFVETYLPDPETKPNTRQARVVGPEKINFSTASRGVRNNNPGNIEVGEAWQGIATGADILSHQKNETRFVVFKNPEFGVRAITKILQTYRVKYGLNTVRGIINRWAPPVENNTDDYVEFVSKFMNVNPDDKLDTSKVNVLNPLITAIIRRENREQPYSETTILMGISLAFDTQEGE